MLMGYYDSVSYGDYPQRRPSAAGMPPTTIRPRRNAFGLRTTGSIRRAMRAARDLVSKTNGSARQRRNVRENAGEDAGEYGEYGEVATTGSYPALSYLPESPLALLDLCPRCGSGRVKRVWVCENGLMYNVCHRGCGYVSEIEEEWNGDTFEIPVLERVRRQRWAGQDRGPLGPLHGAPTFEVQFAEVVWADPEEHRRQKRAQRPGLRRIPSAPAAVWYVEKLGDPEADAVAGMWKVAESFLEYRDFYQHYPDLGQYWEEDGTAYDEEPYPSPGDSEDTLVHAGNVTGAYLDQLTFDKLDPDTRPDGGLRAAEPPIQQGGQSTADEPATQRQQSVRDEGKALRRVQSDPSLPPGCVPKPKPEPYPFEPRRPISPSLGPLNEPWKNL